jgi:hypothetical protein
MTRFRKQIVSSYFQNGGLWTDLLQNDPSHRKIRYIGPQMAQRIRDSMGLQPQAPFPSLEQVLDHILVQTAVLRQPQQHWLDSLQGVLSSMLWNPRHLMCDPTTGYLARIPNRFGFNVLSELVAEAKTFNIPPQPFNISAQAQNVLQHLQSATRIRETMICRFNEGTTGNHVLEVPQSPYLCRDTATNTAGPGPFARAISKCPCHATAQACGADNHCTWDNAIQKCLPSVQSTGNARFGSKYRSSTNGQLYSTYKRNVPAGPQFPPPELMGGAWNAPQGVHHTVGNRHYFAK